MPGADRKARTEGGILREAPLGFGNCWCHSYPYGQAGREQRQMALGGKEHTAGQRLAERKRVWGTSA